MDFYHDLAPFYDEMISFEKRLDKEKMVFHSLLEKFPAKVALDAGCGSGFHSILLSKLGLKVTGIDISDDMLKLAGNNAQKHFVDPTFVKSDFLTIGKTLTTKFDTVFCLGNSFVHLLNDDEQRRVLQNFKDRLNEGGYLCLQIVNYDKFLHEKKRELSVKEAGDKTFTRTYEYHERTITFNVRIESESRQQTISTELYPLRCDEIAEQLKEVGFRYIQKYGNLLFDPYEPLNSENLCLFCR
jgi:glycine/sarcosine N-methyltransferase